MSRRDPRKPRPYPQALQLAAGTHRLCGCNASTDWPHCDGQDSACAHRCHPLQLAQPRFLWICQCGQSRTRPYCDGDGHLQQAPVGSKYREPRP